MGGSLFPTGERLRQGQMLQKNLTLKICNNRKLSSTVTLKKGDDVIAWDAPWCFPFAVGPARASRKSFYVRAGTFSTAWGKIPRCPNPLSPPSQLSHVLCAVSADGYPHRIRAPGDSQKLEFCPNYSRDVQGAECSSLSRWLQPTVSCNHNIKYYYFCVLCLGKHAELQLSFHRISKVASTRNNFWEGLALGFYPPPHPLFLFFFFLLSVVISK